MKKLFLLVLMALLAVPAFAQSEGNTKSSKDDVVFVQVEQSAEFPGGNSAMQQYLVKNIHYTKKARKNNIEGTVYVNFIVEKDGSISNARVIKGLDGGLDKVALKAVKKMPRWNPGMENGKPVRYQFTLPVRFRLQ